MNHSLPRAFRRIVFIEPKSAHIHVYSAVRIPRIGSILLATIARDRGHEVSVVVEDMLRKGVGDDAVWDQICTADLLCVSSITSTIQRCYDYCDRARAAGIPVVIGGTHVTYFPDEALAHADWVMRGECDESFPALLDAITGGGALEEVPGLSWRDGDEVRHTAAAKLPPSAVLEKLPFPDFDLLWQSHLRGGVLSVAAARGCPYDCSFCSVTKFNGAGLRAMSPGRTLDMIEEHWRRYRPHYIFFAEDIFNLSKKRAMAIMEGLADRRIRPAIGFGAQMRHEVATDSRFLELMKTARFDRAMVGFESINQASLDLCGKRETVAQVSAAIRAFHRHGIKVHGMFVAGFDTDTPQTFKDTLRFAKRHHLDSFQLMLLTPLPGTRDWEGEGYADGRRPLLTRDWSKFDGHHAVQVPQYMTAHETNTLAITTMKNFYTMPRAIGRLAKGDWVEFLMRMQARSLIRRWQRAPENRGYLEMLRMQVRPAAAALCGSKRRIIIAHTAASIAMKEKIERFFAELGVKVEHSRAGLGELLAGGQTRLDEARLRIGEFLADKGLFSRDGADMVVVPGDRGGEVALDAEAACGDAPLIMRLNINERAKVMMEQWLGVASAYTTNLRGAAEAFRRAMQEPSAAPAGA